MRSLKYIYIYIYNQLATIIMEQQSIILHIQKSGIYRIFLKVCVKIHYICVYKDKKKDIFKVFINLKTNEKPMVNN